MDEGDLRLRIRVVSVSTRAAVHSLNSDDFQIGEVLRRGQWLLDGLEPVVLEHGSDEVRQELQQAREDLASMDGKAES